MLSSALEDSLRLFGKERFRPMQRELVECALEGRSCIGILPTGSGKSLCYQIPAVLGNGLTVVVSPLIALMRDQVAGLEKLGVAAARYDSTLAEEDKVALMDRLKSGGVRLLFAAPESLESPWIQQVMEFVPPGLFVVAQCPSGLFGAARFFQKARGPQRHGVDGHGYGAGVSRSGRPVWRE